MHLTGAVRDSLALTSTITAGVRLDDATRSLSKRDHIYVDGAADGIAFYKRAFGAEELFRIARPNGKLLHAELSICGSVIMIGDPDKKLYDEPRALGRCSAGLHLFLDDNKTLLRRAVDAGAEEIQPPTDMFYGANSASRAIHAATNYIDTAPDVMRLATT